MSKLVIVVQVEGEPDLVGEVDTDDMNIGQKVRWQGPMGRVAVIVEYRGE